MQSSGGRTQPHIKQSPVMNRKNLRNWEIRLGLLHVVAFLGVIIGVMVCVFLLAFFHGHNSGFEAAARQSLDNIARLPVDSEITNSAIEQQEAIEKKVYAALGAEDQVDVEEDVVPDLSSIPDANEAPKIAEAELAELDKALKENEEIKLAEELVAPAEKAEVIEEDIEEDVEEVQVAVTQEATKKLEKASNIIQGDAGLKIVGETGSVIVIDEDKPQAEKDATLDVLLSDEKSAISQPKEAAVVEKLLPEVEQPEIEVQPEMFEEEPVVIEEEPVIQASEETAKAVIKEEQKPIEVKVTIPESIDQSQFIRTVVPQGWYTQVAAPRNISDAHPLALKLKNSGFSVIIERALVRGDEYFRILVGPEANKILANRLLEQVKRESYISGEPFIRSVR
ncbi:MAG: SPOR domain-containing protein [Bdellovibrionota bacterium]